MRSSRQLRQRVRAERPFRRRFGYETVKEAGGTVLQHVGAGLGALTGLVGAVVGLPGTASVVAGTVIGSAVGAIGKAYLNAAMDERRERAEKQALNRPSVSRNSDDARLATWRKKTGGAGSRARRLGVIASARPAGGHAIGAGPMRQFLTTLEKLIAQLDQASAQLNTLMTQMWESQHRITATLAGARPDVVHRTHEQTNSARLRVHDAATLTRQAADALRAYRAGL